MQQLNDTPATAQPTSPVKAAQSLLRPVQIGRIRVDVPVMLAPMAGVTNAPFRGLCKAQADAALAALAQTPAEASTNAPATEAATSGKKQPSLPAGDATHATAGLYVCEMVTSRALVERNPRALTMLQVAPNETTRSIQLYGVDPATMAAATRMLVERDATDHIDMNFGCPVPKVMRKGGGAALPWKRDHFAAIVSAVVEAAGEVPVTVKMRTGIDATHLTYLEAARDAQRLGAAAVTLHARTAAQHYSGQAYWDTIARLKETVKIPVFGNGDVFEGDDAVKMIAETGCDGVTVGRGCQGRPWLFADIIYALAGSPRRMRPNLGEVKRMIIAHAHGLVDYFGDEFAGVRDLRKHIGWYTRGFPVGGTLRGGLARVDSIAALEELLAELPDDVAYPEDATGPRGRAGTVKKPHLPYGWLDSREVDAAALKVLAHAELDGNGG